MPEPVTTTIDVNGHPCRVWTKGSGPRMGFLAGLGGLPRWLPFLDRLAERRTVIAPSLPGYPGATGHTELDTHLDWILAMRQIVDGAGLAGADLVGASVGGAFAAEMAAIFPGHVRRLALIAPFGLFDDQELAADPWAQRKDVLPGLMCADGANWNELVAAPEGANSVEWPIEMTRASEAAARAFWPLGNTRLEKRLGLISAPTLILWGDRDAILPPSYAGKFAQGINNGINGAARVETVENAGHLAYLDQPDAVARAVLGHFA
ncbi:alpha/beta fold hydrolase [Reyranella sp.]|uniref:alpha/beta fold hydrolase n=1 Tax=Reyranella sp. TaxID=1929291 RepID=UPI0027288537|nr:alpha/beta fold hydrolase [Reyranella sp.]MDO8972523.1 alpha/beta fold hydrolase [Reyranella sp.]